MDHNLHTTLGACQIGYIVGCFFFGLTTVQTYLYFQEFSGDPRLVRGLVAVLWLSDFAHQVFCSTFMYYITITFYGDLPAFLTSADVLIVVAGIVISSGLSVALVMHFYSYQLWTARQQKVAAVTLFVLSLARFVLGTVVAVDGLHSSGLLELIQKHRWNLFAAWIVGATQDAVVTIHLSYDWYEQRDSTLYRSSKLIDRVVMWCLGTGASSCAVAVALLISYIFTWNKNFIWIAFYLPMSSLFSNSLLVSLNARSTFRNPKLDEVIDVQSRFHAALGSPGNDPNASELGVSSGSHESKKNTSIQIMTKTETFHSSKALDGI